MKAASLIGNDLGGPPPMNKFEERIKATTARIHYSRSLLQVPTPTAAARCHAA